MKMKNEAPAMPDIIEMRQKLADATTTINKIDRLLLRNMTAANKISKIYELIGKFYQIKKQ